MKRWMLLLAFVSGAGWWWMHYQRPAAWQGRPAPEAPRQRTSDLPAPWRLADYTFTPLARFSARAIVLSRCNYGGGHDGELAPTDFALGWGCMSDAAVINQLKVSQDMRWFMYSWRGELPVSSNELAISCANVHLIPANETVRRVLARTGRHDLLEITGSLVEVRHPDGWVWRSSLSRDDSGGGACEVIWVDKAERSRPDSR